MILINCPKLKLISRQYLVEDSLLNIISFGLRHNLPRFQEKRLKFGGDTVCVVATIGPAIPAAYVHVLCTL
mgnify:CR=1 FL=1